MNDTEAMELRKMLIREKTILQADIDAIKERIRELELRYFKEV